MADQVAKHAETDPIIALNLDAIRDRCIRAFRWLGEDLPAPGPDETNDQTAGVAAVQTLIERDVPAMLAQLRRLEG